MGDDWRLEAARRPLTFCLKEHMMNDFRRAASEAAAAKWKGGVGFAQEIAVYICEGKFAYALLVMWDRGLVDLDKLVDDVGTEFCEIDAARARGEGDRSRSKAVAKLVRRRHLGFMR